VDLVKESGNSRYAEMLSMHIMDAR